MTNRLAIRRSFLVLLVIAASASLFYHADVLGRFAYAVERGRLRADREHLDELQGPDVATLEQISHAFSVIAEVVKPSVVNIEARATLDIPQDEIRRFFTDRGLPPAKGTGSGVIIDEEGHIVTNNHVINGAEVVDVTLSDGRVFRAEPVGADPQTDIAVIKINADHLHPARFGESDRLQVGNLVLAIGSPFRLGHSVSHGIVSAVGRADVAVGVDYQNWIQTDAPINPGNSGGPLINTRGEVVGINTAIATDSGGHQGVGFAIPSNSVSRVADMLKSGKGIQRGYLGVQIRPVTPKFADAYGLKEPGGVFIAGVGAKSPAAEGGLKPEDIVLAIDGKKIDTQERLQEIIAGTKPDTTLTMTVWRDGASLDLQVRIGVQPQGFSTRGSLRNPTTGENREEEKTGGNAEDQATTEEPDGEASGAHGGKPDGEAVKAPRDDEEDVDSEVEFEQLGFSAANLTPALQKRLRVDGAIRTGVVVTRVTPTGEAYNAGLRPGHVISQVNGQSLQTVDKLGEMFTKEAVAKGIRMKITAGQFVFYAVLQVR